MLTAFVSMAHDLANQADQEWDRISTYEEGALHRGKQSGTSKDSEDSMFLPSYEFREAFRQSGLSIDDSEVRVILF